MDQYLLIAFLGGWTSFTSYFDVHQGYKVLTHCHISTWFLHQEAFTCSCPKIGFSSRISRNQFWKENKAMGNQHGPIPAAGYQIHLALDLESDSRTHWHMSVPVLLILSCKRVLKHAKTKKSNHTTMRKYYNTVPLLTLNQKRGVRQNGTWCLLRGPRHNSVELQPKLSPRCVRNMQIICRKENGQLFTVRILYIYIIIYYNIWKWPN